MEVERRVMALQIKNIESGEVLREIKLSEPLGEFSITLERTMAGLLRNMNRDRFYVDEVYS